MAIGEILTFVGLFKDLAQLNAKIKKENFEQFVVPIWTSFGKIHEDYKQSFREYGQLALNEEYPLVDLVNRIQKDSVYTEDLRLELFHMLHHANIVQAESAYVSSFMVSITRYFRFPQELEEEEVPKKPANIFRIDAMIGINRLSYSSDRQAVVRLLDRIVANMQQRYAEVSSRYYQLKQEMLK